MAAPSFWTPWPLLQIANNASVVRYVGGAAPAALARCLRASPARVCVVIGPGPRRQNAQTRSQLRGFQITSGGAVRSRSCAQSQPDSQCTHEANVHNCPCSLIEHSM
jgi:hypothetical protein